MGRSYYDDFQRYGSRGNFDPRRYLQQYRETPEERSARKAREQRDYEDRKARERRDHSDQGRRDDDDSHKRKSNDDKGRSREGDVHGKKHKTGDMTSSSTHAPKLSETFTVVEVAATSQPLKKDDIQTILKRLPYSLAKAPTRLETRFPNWCLRGVRFDLDVVPVDKEGMLKNLETVRLNIEQLHNWQKLVDEL